MNKTFGNVQNRIMDITMSNLEDKETFFDVPEDIYVKPIEDKIFEDGIREILGKVYD